MMNDHTVFLAAQKKVSLNEPSPADIYRIGTVAKVNQMLKLPNGTFRVLVEGLYRGEIIRYTEEAEEAFSVEIVKIEEDHGQKHEEEALMRTLLDQFEQYIKISRKISKETLASVSDIDEPSRLADIVASHLALKIKEKQELLETKNVKERLDKLIKHISN